MPESLSAVPGTLRTREILYPCLKGSVQETYGLLLAAGSQRPVLENLRRRYFRRFFAPREYWRFPTSDPWIRQVLTAYYRYLRRVLTGGAPAMAEDRLYRDLLGVLPVPGASYPTLDDLEDVAAVAFEARGYRFVGGYTPPYRGPYIWRQTREAVYDIEIPEGHERVTAYLCSGFLLCGWLDFATFGRIGTGGWAKPEGIYLVRHRFRSLQSKQFTVGFLRHEAQHVRDLRRFPALPAEDLEYRAKLVELIYAPSRRQVELWRRGALPDRENAHAYSAYRLLQDLDAAAPSHSWRPARMSATARDLLARDTQRLLEETEGL